MGNTEKLATFLMYPMLPGSLYCPFLCIQCCKFLCIVHSYVSNVASFSVLSILMYPTLPVSLYCPCLCIQCCQFLCIVHSYVSNVASFSVLSILMYPLFYRETGNIGYIRMDNTEKLATLDT
jgi:predicted ABC-type exoprotein transport system permease subunit